MKTILRVDASARTAGSQSRALGDYFENAWIKRNAGDRFVHRDTAENPIPHIASQTITGFYTPEEKLSDELRSATALSDRLIGELRTADVLLLTVPIYNFSIPSALKAWIDQIVRIGHTFAYDGKNFTGLVTGKRAYVICAYGAGGYLGNGPLAGYDFLKPYLTLLLISWAFRTSASSPWRERPWMKPPYRQASTRLGRRSPARSPWPDAQQDSSHLPFH